MADCVDQSGEPGRVSPTGQLHRAQLLPMIRLSRRVDSTAITGRLTNNSRYPTIGGLLCEAVSSPLLEIIQTETGYGGRRACL